MINTMIEVDSEMQFSFLPETIRNDHGAVAIIVGLCLVMFIGFAALAIDIGNLLVARNELQNAADAGALAGARFLYTDDGSSVNEGANQIAYDAAVANNSQKIKVDVNWSGGNTADVQRGHYSFSTKTFTPNASLLATDLWDVSEADLDTDTNFINAVRVVARRDATPVTGFFAGIFGFDNFDVSAEAVAYIGFAGNLRPEDIDQPIAICQQSLVDDDNYTCNIGRMINSGGNAGSSNTGGWTSYDQNSPCSGGTNASEMKGLICSTGNPDPIQFGDDVATSGGEIQAAFKSFYDCWAENSEGKTQPWEMTLLVIDCPGNNITTCQKVVGAVTLTIIWINDQNDPNYNNTPVRMADWPTDTDLINAGLDPEDSEDWETWEHDDMGETRWNSFVSHFNLKNLDESGTGLVDAPYAQKSIYFLPDCTPHDPRGGTGGQNFGILARIPVLVK